MASQPEERFTPGGNRELLQLALPLILSSSFWTMQIAIDRILLSKQDIDAVGAAMMSVMVFWTLLTLVENVASYATTFVAQYTGAKRPHRVGPAVWQALYFSVIVGSAFPLLTFFAEDLMAITGHSPEIQALEATYFRVLCYAVLPILIVRSVNSFFAGRGDSWTVMGIDAVGMTVNGVLAYILINGKLGLPEMGIEGAGWATVIGSAVSAVLGLAVFFRPKYRAGFNTLGGWRFESDLFRRLLRFGLPNGIQWCLEGLAFTVFILFIGKLGKDQQAATSIAFTINLVAFLPMYGLGQAVSILVGQRLGANRPELAEKTTYTGFRLAFLYMGAMSLFYLLWPSALMPLFEPHATATDPSVAARWATVAEVLRGLLIFIAIYALCDSVCVIFSLALRGAGDTLFVTLVSLGLAWPIMVLPTYLAWLYDWGIYWAFTFVTVYVLAMTACFLLRFRHGKWKSMRVIEQVPPADVTPDEPEPAPAVAGSA